MIVFALAGAGLGYGEVEQADAGYVYGDSTCEQSVVYRVGMTGVTEAVVGSTPSSGRTCSATEPVVAVREGHRCDGSDLHRCRRSAAGYPDPPVPPAFRVGPAGGTDQIMKEIISRSL